MGIRGKKPAPRRGRKPPATQVVSESVLDWMTPDELGIVLKALLKKHPDILAEAETIATEMMSIPSVDEVAKEVFDAVTSLGLESFRGRAGRQPGGYVEPTEAAWALLEEAVKGVLEDMKRRLEMGLEAAAEAICCGIVIGLYSTSDMKWDGPLGWAPDFPGEEACYAITELIGTCSPTRRAAVHDHLIQTLGDRVPDWRDGLFRVAADALSTPRR